MTRHTPFEDVQEFVDDLQRRLDPSYRRLDDDVLDWRRSRGAEAVDLVEHDDRFVATFDLPGCEPDDVEVHVEDREVVVDVAREEAHRDEADEGRYVRRQRRRLSAVHTVTFPRDVRGEDATASLEHGVLTVTVPKRDGERDGTRIDVE